MLKCKAVPTWSGSDSYFSSVKQLSGAFWSNCDGDLFADGLCFFRFDCEQQGDPMHSNTCRQLRTKYLMHFGTFFKDAPDVRTFDIIAVINNEAAFNIIIAVTKIEINGTDSPALGIFSEISSISNVNASRRTVPKVSFSLASGGMQKTNNDKTDSIMVGATILIK